MLALSVSISTSSSPTAISSPTCFSQVRIVPSSIESESRGITTSLTGQLHAYRLPLPPARPSPGREQDAGDERGGGLAQHVGPDPVHHRLLARLQAADGRDRLDVGARVGGGAARRGPPGG